MQYNKKSGNALPIIGLMLMASMIIGLGSWFFVYSILNNVVFSVMSSEIPGAIFAAVVIFLGVRYLIATINLIKRVQGKDFSWHNFRIKKTI